MEEQNIGIAYGRIVHHFRRNSQEDNNVPCYLVQYRANDRMYWTILDDMSGQKHKIGDMVKVGYTNNNPQEAFLIPWNTILTDA